MRTTIITAVLFSILFPAVADYNPGWWKSLAFELTPTNDLTQASSVLRRQAGTISFLYGADYTAADTVSATNLWNMLAVLHGDLRKKRIENPPPVFRNFGIVTNQADLQRRIAANEEAKRIVSYDCVRSGLEERIEEVFKKAASSEALASFRPSERNVLVSNLVAVAQLTPTETAALGL